MKFIVKYYTTDLTTGKKTYGSREIHAEQEPSEASLHVLIPGETTIVSVTEVKENG